MISRLSLLLLVGTVLGTPAFSASRLTNVSVRSTAGTGSDTLIVGFTLTGTGTKPILVRGIGPTLGTFGVAGALTDPDLRLYNRANVQIAANDNWGGTPAIVAASAAVGAFALPGTSRDAALLAPLAAGSYSTHVEAAAGTGIALVEAYDTDTANPDLQISNLSARSLSGTGASVLTVGFAITGDTRKTVLIRAVGPTLGSFGVGGTLANPQLRLVSSRGNELGLNDDWFTGAGWGAAFLSVGAFPLAPGSRDSVLLVNLAPGTYTAQAGGVNNTGGVALIEVYDLPSPPATSLVLQPVENTAPVTSTGPFTEATRATVIPVALTQARPAYPFEFRLAGVSGEALIQFTCGPTGVVSNAFTVRATDVRFSEAALAAVRVWTFRPGLNSAGQPVPVTMQVPIIFTLN